MFYVHPSSGSDATTSSVWKNSKLLSVHLRSLYLLAHSDNPCFDVRAGFTDLQKVYDSSSLGTFASLLKALRSVSCPHPNAIVPSSPSSSDLPCVFRTYACTSDGGSDQLKYKRLIARCFQDDDSTFVLQVYCLMHAQQLVVADGLKIIDNFCADNGGGWYFFSTLAKLVYLWRDHANEFDEIWRVTLKCEPSRKLIAKCIAGRWGSIIKTLHDIRDRGVRSVARVFSIMLQTPSTHVEDTAPANMDAIEVIPTVLLLYFYLMHSFSFRFLHSVS